MPPDTVTHWAYLINTTAGSDVKDATPEEVEQAMSEYAKEMGAEYTNKFLKEGRRWRKGLDDDDVLTLSYRIVDARVGA